MILLMIMAVAYFFVGISALLSYRTPPDQGKAYLVGAVLATIFFLIAPLVESFSTEEVAAQINGINTQGEIETARFF